MATTILPFARPCSTYAIASSVSSKANVRSSTGRSEPASPPASGAPEAGAIPPADGGQTQSDAEAMKSLLEGFKKDEAKKP